MGQYRLIQDASGQRVIETPLTGPDLTRIPLLNKGSTFSEEERDRFKIRGLIPCRIESLEAQIERHYVQFEACGSNIAKSIFLSQLQDRNETLFYALVTRYLPQMLPIIYTPTVGDIAPIFSRTVRYSRGLYFSYPDRDKIDQILDNRLNDDVSLIVATDGEGVLGIGDQGIGGMCISVAKLMVYTILGGISPHEVLPVYLDVGTNNAKLIQDSMYLGWRHTRLEQPEYDAFIDQFVSAVQKKFPSVFLHWEDFGINNARRILDKYRHQLCTFNDDIQGTGATSLACVLAALQTIDQKITDQRIVIFGAGTAGIGVADQLLELMIAEGLSPDEAKQRFWLVDRPGILHDQLPLNSGQATFARPAEEWVGHATDLASVVKKVRPTVLIGCSTVQGAFTENIVRETASNCDRPIILPLSNPTSKSEAKPSDLIQWTEGKALIATGSPFDPVAYKNQQFSIAQSNNAYIFPGLGLGVIAAKAHRITQKMIWAASYALASAPKPKGALLPPLSDVPTVSRQIALAVANQAKEEGVATIDTDYASRIEEIFWTPEYYPLRSVDAL